MKFIRNDSKRNEKILRKRFLFSWKFDRYNVFCHLMKFLFMFCWSSEKRLALDWFLHMHTSWKIIRMHLAVWFVIFKMIFFFFFLFRFGFSLQNTKRLTNWYVLNNWNICFGNDKTKLHKMTNEERIRKCHNLYILSDRFPAQLTLICWRIIEKKLIKREKKPNPENKQNTIWAAHKSVIVNMKCEKKNVTIGFLGWIPTKKKQFQLSKCEKSIYFIDYLNIHSLFRTVDSIH